jgi:caffeoyl-CoA O-methyltransferase
VASPPPTPGGSATPARAEPALTVDKFIVLTPEIHRYLVEHSSFRDSTVERVEEAAKGTASPEMQISGDQAALITVLVKAIGARRAIEVGTFLGYGALSIARGLPEDGKLICCELKDEYADRAREHLRAAGLEERVEFRVGPAGETLALIEEDGAFDFAFIDADKLGYPTYVRECLRLLRSGGLIMLDNVLLGGRVLDPTPEDDSAQVMHELNERLLRDDRVDVAMAAVADGITLALKR